MSHSPSQQELRNGFVLARLVFEGGAMALRRVFDSIHPPRDLANRLNENYVILSSLYRRRRILKKDQWELLFPRTGNPSSSRFDVTLLFSLLKNISGLQPPETGWNEMPSRDDHSIEADIVRIAFFRNQFSHRGHWFIDTPTFSTLSRELCEIYSRFDLLEDEINMLTTNTIWETEEPKKTKSHEIKTERPLLFADRASGDTCGELASVSTHFLANEGKYDK